MGKEDDANKRMATIASKLLSDADSDKADTTIAAPESTEMYVDMLQKSYIDDDDIDTSKVFIQVFDNSKCIKILDDLMIDGGGYGDKKDYVEKILKASYSNAGMRYVEIERDVNKKLAAIKAVAPNFGDEIIKHLQAPLLISAHTRLPARIPPVLLVGAAGVGKTRAARHVGGLLSPITVAHAYSAGDIGASLGGLDKGWNSGAAGKVFTTLANSAIANPVFILDEIDKIQISQSSKGGMTDPTAELLQLLEKESASKFTDKCIDFQCDASYCIYIATANNLSNISKPLLSRFNIILATKPDASQAVDIVDSINLDICKEYNVSIKSPRGALMELLADKNPRTICKILSIAIAYPIINNRKYYIMDDIVEAINCIISVNTNDNRNKKLDRMMLH